MMIRVVEKTTNVVLCLSRQPIWSQGHSVPLILSRLPQKWLKEAVRRKWTMLFDMWTHMPLNYASFYFQSRCSSQKGQFCFVNRLSQMSTYISSIHLATWTCWGVPISVMTMLHDSHKCRIVYMCLSNERYLQFVVIMNRCESRLTQSLRYERSWSHQLWHSFLYCFIDYATEIKKMESNIPTSEYPPSCQEVVKHGQEGNWKVCGICLPFCLDM